MSDDELDPGANTEMFQAFVDRHPQADSRSDSSGSGWLWAAVVAGVLVILLAVAWFVLGG